MAIWRKLLQSNLEEGVGEGGMSFFENTREIGTGLVSGKTKRRGRRGRRENERQVVDSKVMRGRRRSRNSLRLSTVEQTVVLGSLSRKRRMGHQMEIRRRKV